MEARAEVVLVDSKRAPPNLSHIEFVNYHKLHSRIAKSIMPEFSSQSPGDIEVSAQDDWQVRTVA